MISIALSSTIGDLMGQDDLVRRELVKQRREWYQKYQQARSELEALQQRVEAYVALLKGIDKVLALDKGDQPAPAQENARLASEPKKMQESEDGQAKPSQPSATSNVQSEEDQPRGQEAVRRALMESSTPVSFQELTDELQRRGWLPQSKRPMDAVRVAFTRLSSSDRRFVRLPDGRLAYRPDAPLRPEQATAGGTRF